MKLTLAVPGASSEGAHCLLPGFTLHSHMEEAEERDARKAGGSGWLGGASLLSTEPH